MKKNCIVLFSFMMIALWTCHAHGQDSSKVARTAVTPMSSLSDTVINLKEVDILAPEARERQTPVAATTIPATRISRQLGDQPLPEIMKFTPGVYATREGGGSGDASLNIRGFKQENVALLLNGVPVGSAENGLVYWNNWLGLADATRQVQVQRGLGASRTALNSIGGTINIVTKTTDAEKGGSLKMSVTDYGNLKTTLSLSTGQLSNGVSVTLLGSRFKGPGYVDATYVDGWAYFLSVSKSFGNRHMLAFTALGNPERHGQRNFKLSKAEIDQYGLKYNKDWGSDHGVLNNASENYYHKPHLSLNHYWAISDRDLLATALYYSPGKGGGKWTETFGNHPWLFSYYDASGQIDWDAVYQLNRDNQEVYTLADGRDTTGYSLNIQTDFLASHQWGGLVSTFQHEFSPRLKLTAGFHGRLFQSTLQEKVRDLLGGGFFIDDYAYAIDGVGGRNQVKHVGDIIRIDNGATAHMANLFGQLEYARETLSFFLSAGINGNWFRRVDRYNYINDIKSDWVFKEGYDIKGGLNINIDPVNNIYFNAGYFSRAPYYKYVFGNFNNTPTKDLLNEKITSVEAGYGFLYKKTRLKLNGYLSYWKDRSVLTNEYNQFEDPTMLRGINALHTGIEAEISQGLGEWLVLGAMASLADWRWKNDVTALLLNDDMVVIDTINVYADGLLVGDAPMLQLGLSVKVKILRTFDLEAQWSYNDKLYADFNPALRTDPEDDRQPYRIPAYQVTDLYLTYPFMIAATDFELNVGCYNLFNSHHIIRGTDGSNHSPESFTGFWGFGRTLNVALKVDF